MARVVDSRNALANLERARSALDARSPDAAIAAVDAISSGRSGYLALDRFVPARREVRILAIRHPRELDDP